MKRIIFLIASFSILLMFCIIGNTALAQDPSGNETQITNVRDMSDEFWTLSDPEPILDENGNETGLFIYIVACYKKKGFWNNCRRRSELCVRPTALKVDEDLNIISTEVLETGEEVELFKGQDGEGKYVRSTDNF